MNDAGRWRAAEAARHRPSKPYIGSAEEVSARYQAVIERAKVGAYPAEPQGGWRWQIAGYLYLGGLGAGAFAVAVVLDWLGFGLAPTAASPVGDWTWDWSRALSLWGPLVAGIGASLLILDLGRNWLRFFTAGKNPGTSWMARGFSIVLSFILLGCLVGAVSVFAPEWRADLPALWRVIEVFAVLTALGTALYTGVLLRSMSYIPAWSSPHLPVLFFVSALSTGAMGVLLGAVVYMAAGGHRESAEGVMRSVELFEPLVVAVEAVVLTLYVRSLTGGKPEAVLSARILTRGAWRYPFWAGVVGLALGLPFVLDLVNLAAGSPVIAVVAAVSVLAGGVALRLVVLGVGVKELPPLYRLGQWRSSHALQPGG